MDKCCKGNTVIREQVTHCYPDKENVKHVYPDPPIVKHVDCPPEDELYHDHPQVHHDRTHYEHSQTHDHHEYSSEHHEHTQKHRPFNLPLVFILLMGVILVTYAATDKNIDGNVRAYSIVIAIVWTLIWVVLLGHLWHRGKYAISWWLSLIGFAGLLVYMIVLIFVHSDNQ